MALEAFGKLVKMQIPGAPIPKMMTHRADVEPGKMHF